MTEHDDVSGTLVNKNIVLMISNNTMSGFNGHKIFFKYLWCMCKNTNLLIYLSSVLFLLVASNAWWLFVYILVRAAHRLLEATVGVPNQAVDQTYAAFSWMSNK